MPAQISPTVYLDHPFTTGSPADLVQKTVSTNLSPNSGVGVSVHTVSILECSDFCLNELFYYIGLRWMLDSGIETEAEASPL